MNEQPNTKRPRNMRRKAIVEAIRAKHGSLRAFAEKIHRPPSMVSQVAAGHIVSSPLARQIADVVGREPHEIWPRIYAEDGGPLSTFYRRAS